MRNRFYCFYHTYSSTSSSSSVLSLFSLSKKGRTRKGVFAFKQFCEVSSYPPVLLSLVALAFCLSSSGATHFWRALNFPRDSCRMLLFRFTRLDVFQLPREPTYIYKSCGDYKSVRSCAWWSVWLDFGFVFSPISFVYKYNSYYVNVVRRVKSLSPST